MWNLWVLAWDSLQIGYISHYPLIFYVCMSSPFFYFYSYICHFQPSNLIGQKQVDPLLIIVINRTWREGKNCLRKAFFFPANRQIPLSLHTTTTVSCCFFLEQSGIQCWRIFEEHLNKLVIYWSRLSGVSRSLQLELFHCCSVWFLPFNQHTLKFGNQEGVNNKSAHSYHQYVHSHGKFAEPFESL